MSTLPYFDFQGTLLGSSPNPPSFYTVEEYSQISSMLFSNSAATVTYLWSTDRGLNTDYLEVVNLTAGVTSVNYLPIRAKYLCIQYDTGVTSELRCSHLFHEAPQGVSSLANSGAGVQVYNPIARAVRTLTSLDSSVTISQLASTVDLSVPLSTATLTSTGGTSLVVDGAGPDLQIKGLLAGNGISLLSNPENLEIVNSVSLTNAGGSHSLVAQGTNPLITKGITAGTNISVTPSATDLTLSFTGSTGDDVTLSSAGGTSLVSDGTGPTLAIKGVQTDSNLTIADFGTYLRIGYAKATGDDVTLASAGGTYSIVSDQIGPFLGVKGISTGPGISVTDSGLALTFANTAPDKTVSLTSGTGISATGTYPNFTITNTAPDRTVTLTAGTNISITGTYPNFTINSTAGGSSLQYVYWQTASSDASIAFSGLQFVPVRLQNPLGSSVYEKYGNTSNFLITRDPSTNYLRFTYIGSTSRTFFFQVRASVPHSTNTSATTLGLSRNGLYPVINVYGDLGSSYISTGSNSTVWQITHTTISVLNPNDYIHAVMTFAGSLTTFLDTFNFSIHSID